MRILETAKGMDSKIVLLRDAAGAVRYAGWYRKLVDTGRVIYTGFYMVGHTPHGEKPAVKVVFPMPHGNATVILRPSLDRNGEFELSSAGQAFGDVGFYHQVRFLGMPVLHLHYRIEAAKARAPSATNQA